MSLSKVLANLSEQHSFILRRPLHRSKLEQEVNHLVERIQRVGTARNEFDREALVSKLRRISKQGTWHLLSREDLKRSILLLSYGRPQLQEDRRIFKGILKRICEYQGSGLCRSLIAHYLRCFDAESPNTKKIAKLLDREIRSRAGLEKWKKRHAAYGLFDSRNVTSRLTKEILSKGEVEQVLHDAGIHGDAITSGVGRQCFKIGCRIVQDCLSEQESTDLAGTLMRWAKPQGGEFRYLNERKFLAEALLLPWVDSDPTDEELKNSIASFLDGPYGDPRVDRSRWSVVSDAAVAVRFRWLAGRSLKLFLDIVGDTTDRPDQWEYRRAFWDAYMNRRHVTNAWVAFGRDGQTLVERMIRESDESIKGNFAHLESVQRSQAVLLMHIADLVIADWSHNGALRIWHKDHANAPKMYRSRYNGHQLRTTCNKEFRHWPVTGRNCWQNQTHDYIRKWTRMRIEIPRYEYMP